MSAGRLAPFAPRRVATALWPPLLFLVGLILLWKLALAQGWVKDIIVPHPEDVVVSFYELLRGGFIWDDIRATFYETVAGFLLGASFGIALALPSGLSPTMTRMLQPYAVGLQVTPRIAIAPIVIAWAGFGYSSKIIIAAIISFFPVYVNALTGIITVDADAREMFRSLGASRLQTFVRLMLPSSLPVMFAGLKTAAALALVGAVVGEFISAQAGLGLLVQQFSYQLAVDDAFAVIFMLMLMGLALYGAMEYLERLSVFWLHDARLVARTRRRTARAGRKAARLVERGGEARPVAGDPELVAAQSHKPARLGAAGDRTTTGEE